MQRVHQLSLDAVNDPNRRRAAAKNPGSRPQILVTKIKGQFEEQEPWIRDDNELTIVDGDQLVPVPPPQLIELELSEMVEIQVRTRDGELLFVADAKVDIGFTHKDVSGTTLKVKTQTLVLQ